MKTRTFASSILLLLISLMPSPLCANDRGALVFEDNFERNESQEIKDEVGNGWGTNSEKRADGNKQVDLRDGAMYICLHPDADHAVSITHPAGFRNGSVELRFMLENEQDTLGLNFADLQYKKVWAGHLFRVTIGIKQIELTDLKTGVMDLNTRQARLSKQLTPAQKTALKTKTKRFARRLEVGRWYTVIAKVQGETLSVVIDEQNVGSFSSPGIAHPSKRTLRLAVRRNAVVDDVKIYSVSSN